jgi:hypothetical protein
LSIDVFESTRDVVRKTARAKPEDEPEPMNDEDTGVGGSASARQAASVLPPAQRPLPRAMAAGRLAREAYGVATVLTDQEHPDVARYPEQLFDGAI